MSDLRGAGLPKVPHATDPAHRFDSPRCATVARARRWCCCSAPGPAAETPATAELGTRVALVIGNGAYGELGTLPNPPNDASDVSGRAEKLDFKVTRVVDGNADDMRRALRDFGSSATGADVALFYYAGHGMALNGENYLVPVQAHIENELDLRYETLALSDVRDALDFTDAHLKMVILDACRDNPALQAAGEQGGATGRGLQHERWPVAMQVRARERHVHRLFDGARQRRPRRQQPAQQPVHQGAADAHRDAEHRRQRHVRRRARRRA